MANRSSLRGVEGDALSLIFEFSTAQEWAELLQAALERALAQGNRNIAHRLFTAGIRIENALHAAVQAGDGWMVNYLLRAGVSLGISLHGIDNEGRTPLHVAAGCGETAMVQLFLQSGAQIDVLDDEGTTSLLLAASRGRSGAALALIAAGAAVNILSGENNRSVVHIAADKELLDVMNAAIEREVLERKALVNEADTGQDTPLHRAAVNNNVKAIDALVQAGAETEARNCYGHTPLHEAARTLGEEALRALLRHHGDINTQDDTGETPLFYAAFMAGRQGHADMVDLLLKSGADMTIVDEHNRAPVNVIGGWFDGRPEDPPNDDVDRVTLLLPPI